MIEALNAMIDGMPLKQAEVMRLLVDALQHTINSKVWQDCAATCAARIAEKNAEIARLRLALAFYADEESYMARDFIPDKPDSYPRAAEILFDNGYMARKALEQTS